MAIITFIAGAISNTYAQEPDSKSVKARQNLKESKNDETASKKELKEAKKDSISEYQQFKNESDIRIVAHNKSIADFKARIAKEKKENRAQYEKKLSG